MDYNGKPLIDYIIDECKKTELPIVVAIPKGDDILFDHLIGKVNVFSGSLNDVISRYYKCAKEYKFDTIIRVCADAKHVKSELILQQLDNYKKYHDTCFGNFCWVFSFEKLKHYYYNDKRPETREHVVAGMIHDMTVDYEIDFNTD